MWGLGAAVLPVIAGAQAGPGGFNLPNTADYGTSGQISSLGNAIVNWMFYILLILAVIFIVYAAFLYLTSGGDEEKTGKARQMIIAAVIAIAIAILAKGMVGFVLNFFGQGTATPLGR